MANGNKGSVQQRTWVQRFFSAATARTTGWTDSIKSMFFLLLIGGIFAAIPLVTGFMTATALSYITAYEISMLALMALAVFNYCFAATLEGLKLKALPPIKPQESHAGLDLVDIVNNLSYVAKTHEVKKAAKENRQPKKFPKNITVAMFTNEHSKKVISASNRFGSWTLYLPSGLLNDHSPLTEQEIAALIMVELLKRRNARARRGFFNTCAKIGLYFMELIENAFESPYMLVRLFAYASGPLQFFLMYEKSCSRTYHFEAMKDAIEIGGEPFREALIKAYTKIGKPTLDIGVELPAKPPLKKVKLTSAQLQAKAEKKAQKGKIQILWKRYSRAFFHFCETSITQVGKGVNEIFSDMPSATHTMEFLNALTPCKLELRKNFAELENNLDLVQKNVLYLRKSKKHEDQLVVMILNPDPKAEDKTLECRIEIDNIPDDLTSETIQNIAQEIVDKTKEAMCADYGVDIVLYAKHSLPKLLKDLSTKPLHSHSHGHEHACKPPTLAKGKVKPKAAKPDNVFPLFNKSKLEKAKRRVRRS